MTRLLALTKRNDYDYRLPRSLNEVTYIRQLNRRLPLRAKLSIERAHNLESLRSMAQGYAQFFI
jgi:hypothetical protein